MFVLEHDMVPINYFAPFAGFDMTIDEDRAGSNQHLGLTAAADNAADLEHLEQLYGLPVQFNFLLGQRLVTPVLRPLDGSKLTAAKPARPG